MNELATLQPKEITMNAVQIASTMGELAYKSGIYKAPKPEAAAMIMLKGYELGFPMTASAEFIQVIEGTVGLTPRGALAIMHSHPDIIRSVTFEELEKDGAYYGCKCTIVRIKSGQDVTYSKTFTLDDARQAQLVKPNSGWEKYPAQMCQWRAMGFAADIACPDLLAGLTGLMKMPEMMEDGSAYLPDTERNTPAQTIEIVSPETKTVTLSDLLSMYDAADILAANNGAMPRNNEECASIAETLEKLNVKKAK